MDIFVGHFFLSLKFSNNLDNFDWWLTEVYGPCSSNLKFVFLDELRQLLSTLDSNWVIGGGLTASTFLVLLCVAFIALGLIMDAFAMVAVLPVVMPAVQLLGIDTIHLGVIFVVASMIGTMTPPVAGAIYFTGALFSIPTTEIIRGILPFLVIMIIGLFIFAFFPDISTWLPGTMFG